MRLRNGLAAAAALLLAACGSNGTASYLIDGTDAALTLERNKDYLWTEKWELELVVRRNPDCQRRHALNPSGLTDPRVDVFTPAPQVYIIKQDKYWYVTDLKTCALQAYKEAPPEPGTLIGSFAEKDGVFKFVKTP
jgi:hypothetical protein